MTLPASHPDAPPVLELVDVHQQFGKTAVVRGVSLRVAAGERVALIGPNGAGKSTLFNLISGRHAPSAGEVRLRGQRIDGWPPHRIHRLGLARSFQVSQLFGRLSVEDHLRCAALGSLGHRYTFWRPLKSLQDVQARVEDVLHRVQLASRRGVPAQHLTYAEQRALEIGLTLAGHADVLLLDEPTAGMSQSETARFVELLREVTAGRTLVTVEHDMSVVFGLADRVAVLVQGELIAFDTPQAVRADVRVQAAYLGTLPDGAVQPEAH
jgi:branched-chain amino acid transport system ATP-binding protein